MRMLITATLTLALAGCWEIELPSGDKTAPEYWSAVFLDKYADELTVGPLEPGPPPLVEARTVLLITGVTIRDVWFDPIVARLERDGFVPVVYEPPALLSGSLVEATEELAEVVARVKDESGQERIDILGECTGGVIARHYIQSYGGATHVARLVTFVAPHSGVDKAPLAASIAGWPALYDLSPGSAFLEAVNSAPLPPEVPVTSIYTCTDEYIRPYTTSIVEGATNIGLCDGFVGHFETFFDPDVYAIMHAALTAPTGRAADEAIVAGAPGEAPEGGDAPGGASEPDDAPGGAGPASGEGEEAPGEAPGDAADAPGDEADAPAPRDDGFEDGLGSGSASPSELSDGEAPSEGVAALGCRGGATPNGIAWLIVAAWLAARVVRRRRSTAS